MNKKRPLAIIWTVLLVVTITSGYLDGWRTRDLIFVSIIVFLWALVVLWLGSQRNRP